MSQRNNLNFIFIFCFGLVVTPASFLHSKRIKFTFCNAIDLHGMHFLHNNRWIKVTHKLLAYLFQCNKMHFNQIIQTNLTRIIGNICFSRFRWICRAVVWTDFIQYLVILIAFIAIIMLGLDSAGGFTNVWSAAERGKRIILFK